MKFSGKRKEFRQRDGYVFHLASGIAKTGENGILHPVSPVFSFISVA